MNSSKLLKYITPRYQSTKSKAIAKLNKLQRNGNSGLYRNVQCFQSFEQLSTNTNLQSLTEELEDEFHSNVILTSIYIHFNILLRCLLYVTMVLSSVHNLQFQSVHM